MKSQYHQTTRSAFLWSRILRTPFWAVYLLLPIILYKDLHASPLQIGVIVSLKPSVSLLSMYWASWIKNRRDLLVPNLIWASILGLIPFFFFPLIDNPWFIIFSFGFFMVLHRGVVPAWMEIMKLNLPGVSRQRIFAWGSAFGYLGEGLFNLCFGLLLDDNYQAWRWLLPLTAIIAVIPVLFQYRIKIPENEIPQEKSEPLSLKEIIVRPWKNSWDLLVSRPDFRGFQVGFMLGGMGLMFMQSVVPAFFVSVLNLTYTELAVALTLCKGIGMTLTSEMWAQWMHRVDIYRFTGLVTFIAFLFPLILIGAQYQLIWLYVAYIIYGVMQAGSELSWNLSGPVFAKNEDSTLYSGVNLIAGGLRGCIAPACGLMLSYLFNPSFSLVVGGIFCLMASGSMLSSYKKWVPQSQSDATS